MATIMPVGPRRPKGPPLNALRAFEAAARLQSFVAAAEELGVSAGAISQHIKSVESWAGATLFERTANGVALSTAGRRLAPDFTAAFDHLAAATQSLRTLAPNPDIHIAALPAIAQLWLPPRLKKLRDARPDLGISVTALETPPRLSRDLFDLSIFFSTPAPGPDRLVLEPDIIFPVCAKDLARTGGEGIDLETATLLHDQSWQTDWALWSQDTGIPIGDPTRGPRYSLYALALEEAKSGAGILMGHASLVEQALLSGHLLRASDKETGTGRALVIDLPHRSRRHPDITKILTLLGALSSP